MTRDEQKKLFFLILMALLICLTGCGRHEGAGTEAPGPAEESVSKGLIRAFRFIRNR